jgi:peroxiredoxin
MRLRSKLDSFKARFGGGAPPWFNTPKIGEILRRSVTDLNASGVVDQALKVGDIAPDFRLEDGHGLQLSSRILRRRGPLVVVFYRGVWCPYCNMELQALQEVLPEIRKRGAGLVAISPQVAEHSRRAQAENALSFPLLVDPKNEIAAAYGIRWKQQDYLIDLYRTIFEVDLEAFNGEASWTLPAPSRFVIGDGGRVFHADISVDHTQRPRPEDLLPALDAARNAGRG